MGYGSDGCVRFGSFTEQQIARMRCFLSTPPRDGGLSTWVENPGTFPGRLRPRKVNTNAVLACKVNTECNDRNLCTNDFCVNGTCVFKEIVCRFNYSYLFLDLYNFKALFRFFL